VQHGWARRKVDTGFWWWELEGDHLEDQSVDGEIINMDFK
jgi:hypothetical protein